MEDVTKSVLARNAGQSEAASHRMLGKNAKAYLVLALSAVLGACDTTASFSLPSGSSTPPPSGGSTTTTTTEPTTSPPTGSGSTPTDPTNPTGNLPAPTSSASPSPSPSASASPSPTPTPSSTPVTVCNPLNGSDGAGTGGTNINGLVSSLRYLLPNEARCSDLACMTSTGHLSNSTIYLNDVNVPTRMFSEGFAGPNGKLLTDDQGNTLLEYFSLSMDSQITLLPHDPIGNYQFALLSDDGSVLSIDPTGNGMETWINDDGDHSTQMGCAPQPTALFPGQLLPMHLDYFQGPRYQIALVLLWRPWSSDAGFTPLDPQCGKWGNFQFFNPNNSPSTPEQAYLDLLARGWKPLAPGNFVLPGAHPVNPCVGPTPTPTPTVTPCPSVPVCKRGNEGGGSCCNSGGEDDEGDH